jgi:hypothetical protein
MLSNNDIKMVDPIHLSRNMEESLDYLAKKGETIFDFAGSSIVESLFYLYLIKKYKSDCYVGVENKKNRRIGLTIDMTSINNEKEKMKLYEYLNEVAIQVADCIIKGKKIIIIPLQLMLKKGNHANVLIYRKTYNELEHFEPHGKFFNDNKYGEFEEKKKYIFDLFVKLINDELIRNRTIIKKIELVKYIESSNVCPYIDGFQNIESLSKIKKEKKEPGGYCVAWSMFFTELCLKNPEVSSSILLDSIYDILIKMPNASDYLRKVIRGYAGIICEKFTKYLSVFFKEKITLGEVSKLFRNRNIKTNYEKLIKINHVLELLVNIEILMLEPDSDPKLLIKEINKIIKLKLPKNYTRKDRKEMEKIDQIFRYDIYKKKILQNYDEYNKMLTPLLEEDKMSLKQSVNDKNKEKIEIEKTRKKRSPKAKTLKQTSPKAKTLKVPDVPIILPTKNCKSNEIINEETGKCVRLTTIIKQIIKKEKLNVIEGDIQKFIDFSYETKIPLTNKEEISRALIIFSNKFYP